MGLLERIRVERQAEKRAVAGVPWRPWDSPGFGGRQAFAIGGPRSPTEALADADSVLGLSAVYGCIRHLADSVASLPILTYRRSASGQAERMNTSVLLGDEVAGGGPQVDGSLYDWIFSATAEALTRGSCFGYIVSRSGIPGPDGNGLPSQIAWLPGSRIHVQNNEQHPEDPRRAKVFYFGQEIPQSDLVHLKAFSVPGRLEGISPLRAHASVFAHGKAAQNYARAWFDTSGGFAVGVFQNQAEEVDQSQATEVKRRLGDAIMSRQPLVLGRDWDYKPVTVPPDEAQFVTSQQLSATQIAAIYGVPPWRVGGIKGGSLTYSSQVMDAIDELQNTIRPWLRRWEHLLTGMLPATQYAKFDADAFLKVDPLTRAQVRQIQRETGERAPNELRAEDDKAPIAGGDDAIPLAAVTRLAGSARAVPKSWAPLLEFETDRSAALLEHLQAEDIAAPSDGKPPINVSPEQFLGAQIVAGRQAEAALAELRARREISDGSDSS